MANANPSRVGQNKLAGATDALFLSVFGGEVLTAYEAKALFKDKVRTRVIAEGSSARFPAVYRAAGQYHTPGAEIAGQNIPHTELTLTVDDMLIADAFVAQIDELKNHYDVRGPYAQELGYALALIEDRILSMSLLKAARSAELFTGDGTGGKVIQTDVSGAANFNTSGSDLWAAFAKGLQRMDENDVPTEGGVNAAVKPAQWYLMALAQQNVNRDYNQDADSGQLKLSSPYGVNVFKSNALLFGKDVTPYNAGTNADGLVGLADLKYGLPAAFPAKYQADLSGVTAPVGIMWTDAAIARLQLLGVQMETEWDIRRQGTLMVAKMSTAAGTLRGKCAVEIALT